MEDLSHPRSNPPRSNDALNNGEDKWNEHDEEQVRLLRIDRGRGSAYGGEGGATSLQASVSVAKAVMGAGSFALPWAFSKTGYVAGPVLMAVLMALSIGSIKTLTRCRRLLPPCTGGMGVEISYVDVARCAYGPRGAAIVYAASVSASVGVCGSYLVFVAATLVSMLPASAGGSQSAIVLSVLPPAVLLSSVRDASRFAVASLLGDVSVFLGMMVVVVYGAMYGDGRIHDCVAVASLDTLPLAFGAVGFLFFIHFLVLPIEESMARPADFDAMLTVTFGGCALLSAAFGVAGYLSFGDGTKQIVILNLTGSAVVSWVKALLCADLLFTYPVVMRPSIKIAERTVVGACGRAGDGDWAHLATCTGLGLIAVCAGLFVPAFGLLSGLVGGVSQTFLGFVVPPLMLARLRRRKKEDGGGNDAEDCGGGSRWEDFASVGTVVFGIVMIVWTVQSTWMELRRGRSG